MWEEVGLRRTYLSNFGTRRCDYVNWSLNINGIINNYYTLVSRCWWRYRGLEILKLLCINSTKQTSRHIWIVRSSFLCWKRDLAVRMRKKWGWTFCLFRYQYELMIFNKYTSIKILKHVLSFYLILGISDDFRFLVHIYNICEKPS